MPLRDAILEVSPGWLKEPGGVAEGLQYSEGSALDAISDWANAGVKAAMPGIGTPDALYLIGRDMLIDRGPAESNASYAIRLQGAINSHRIRGNAAELLRQLLAWFSPSTATPLRVVANNGTWHSINPSTGAVTKLASVGNWTWDAYAATRWWRGWLIIDSSAGPWTCPLWGAGAPAWGSGCWGTSATSAEIENIRTIVSKWKPANMHCVNIIVTYNATLFESTDSAPPNPTGSGDLSSWRLGYNAAFWTGVT